MVMWGYKTRRATACISTASRKVGPLRERPFQKNGASIWTKGSGTNSVIPPVRSWSRLMCRRCLAQCTGCSICPYIIVLVVRSPTLCASSSTRNHSSVLILSGQSVARTSSSRISAAVPGSVLSPASFHCNRKSCRLKPSVRAPCQTSSGENA